MTDLADLAPITRRDTTSTVNVEYIGTAQSGTAESTAAWSIMKVTKDGDEVTATAWAGGKKTAEFKWTERTTYTYS